MIGQAFNQLFVAGDVIYGISQPRLPYTQSLLAGVVGRDAATLINEGNFVICDHYNNRSFNAFGVMDQFRGPNAQPGDDAANYAIQNGLNPNQRQAVSHYYNLLSGHKYNPHTAMNVVMNDKQRLHNAGQNDYLAFRRACKFGLDYFIIQLNRRVHFILDVDNAGTCIDFEKIVFKEIYTNVNNNNQQVIPITYSELRKCYKNRLIYGNNVYFYLNRVRVAAPWDDDPDLWAMIDTAKALKQNVPIDLHQNGHMVRQAHVVMPVPVPAPKTKKGYKFWKK